MLQIGETEAGLLSEVRSQWGGSDIANIGTQELLTPGPVLIPLAHTSVHPFPVRAGSAVAKSVPSVRAAG